MKPAYLLLGIGNADRGDDGAGPKLAESLSRDADLQRLGVDILPHPGEGASLMDLWEGTALTVVVDAMKSKTPIGTVRRIDAHQETLSSGVFHYSSHLFSLAEAVEMARQLDRLPKALIIYGIEGANYEFGAPLSPEVAAAMEKVAECVRGEFIGACGESNR